MAFANTQGGRIFLGIDDDCGLLGIDEPLSKWAQSQAGEVACNRYFGALLGRIRDVVVGDPGIRFMQTLIDDYRIAIIEVSAAQEKPICIHQDKYLYIRRGSSNSKASPLEWKTIIGMQKPNFLA